MLFRSLNRRMNDCLDDMEDPVGAESDYSKYDGSQGKVWKILVKLLQATGFFLFAFGKEVGEYMYLKTYAVGKGFKYTVPFTMKSGSNITSVGNSAFNGLVWLYALYLYCLWAMTNLDTLRMEKLYSIGYQSGTCMFVFILFKCPRWIIAYLTSGDDGFTLADDKYIDTGKFFEFFRSVAAALALVLKLKINRNLTALDYLNMRFYYVDGKIRMGRKPGRGICKAGTILDRPLGKQHTYFKRSEYENHFFNILFSNLYAAIPCTNHVPFLGAYNRTLMEHLIERGISPEECDDYVPLAEKRIQRYRYLAGEVYTASSDTWEQFAEVYGLDQSDEEDFITYFKKSLKLYGVTAVLEHRVIAELRDHEA